jgi:hypothetical protein
LIIGIIRSFVVALRSSFWRRAESCNKTKKQQKGKLTMNAMLSEALQEFTGLLGQLLKNLLGNDADTWGDEFKRFLRKEPCWVKSLPMSITVDCDLDPKISSGLFLTGKGTEHRKMGKITLEKRADGKLYANNKEVIRYLSPNQENGKVIDGYKLRQELKDKQVLNACILDVLLDNPWLIPDEWKDGFTWFWGTIFCDSDGDLCVRCLHWSVRQWRRGSRSLGSSWGVQFPAALLAD